MLGFLLLSSTTVSIGFADPVPVATLDPTTVTKYVTPLVIPPVMPYDGVPDNYEIAVRQFEQQILPVSDGIGSTTVWSYGSDADTTPELAPDFTSSFYYPSFTVETTAGSPVNVRWINDLKDPITGDALPHLHRLFTDGAGAQRRSSHSRVT